MTIRRHLSFVVFVFLLVLTPAGASLPAAAPDAPPTAGRAPAGGAALDPALQELVRDYVGLYKAATLDAWKKLFHPALLVADPRPDGSIRTRNLEEFFGAQQKAFASGAASGERLENVRIDSGRRIARVVADYVFTGEGKESRGKLGLHAVQGSQGWTIVSIVFSYDEP